MVNADNYCASIKVISVPSFLILMDRHYSRMTVRPGAKSFCQVHHATVRKDQVGETGLSNRFVGTEMNDTRTEDLSQ